MSNTTPPRTNVYARVTDRIIADLEAGVRPWLKPWKGRQSPKAASLSRAVTTARPTVASISFCFGARPWLRVTARRSG